MIDPGTNYSLKSAVVTHARGWLGAWNRFWFSKGQSNTLCLMRILVGCMLFYTHAVWTLELESFFSNNGVFNNHYQESFHGPGSFAWSHFNWFDSATWMWFSHFLSLAVLCSFTVGFATRVTGWLSFLIVVSYAHRASGALFGLDQINGFLILYLALSPCGSMYSVDKMLRPATEPKSTVMANLATRLIQIHLCVVYLFAGIGKLLGAMWWDGTALWGAFASYEYQTIDMTFLSNWPLVVNLMTLTALAWEVSYAFLVWPKLTRPLFVLLSVPVHLGIGMCMGMMTFGMIMMIANFAFVSPTISGAIMDRMKGISGQVFSRADTA